MTVIRLSDRYCRRQRSLKTRELHDELRIASREEAERAWHDYRERELRHELQEAVAAELEEWQRRRIEETF